MAAPIIADPLAECIFITRAAPDSPAYTFWPPPEGPHKSVMFQHGCPHHWKPPGRMYFYNMSIKELTFHEIIPNARQPHIYGINI